MGKRISVMKNFFRIVLVLVFLIAMAYGLPYFEKISEESLAFVNNYVALVNGVFFKEWITGITI